MAHEIYSNYPQSKWSPAHVPFCLVASETGTQLPKNPLRPVEGKGCLVVIDGMALIPDVWGILAVESK